MSYYAKRMAPVQEKLKKGMKKKLTDTKKKNLKAMKPSKPSMKKGAVVVSAPRHQVHLINGRTFIRD